MNDHTLSPQEAPDDREIAQDGQTQEEHPAAQDRTINFRAWTGQKLIYADHSPFYFSFAGGSWGLWNQFGNECLAGTEAGGILEQFTGLHDKNGKEIYEGDVIGPFGGASAFAVKWEKAGYWNCMRVPNMEVIGNIHENPDLLT